MLNKLCIIIPIYNEEKTIENNIEILKQIETQALIIFVDGKSQDKTQQLLITHGFNVITSPNIGRGAQIAYAIRQTPNDCQNILILHIDTQLPSNFRIIIDKALSENNWGFFRVSLNSNEAQFRFIEFLMNMRSKVTSIATGDQAIFFRKNSIVKYCDEISNHPLMEDIFMSKTLKKHNGYGYVSISPVITSTRYWQKNGVIKTIIKMWKFRLMYYFGVSPNKLYKLYYK